MTPILAEAVSWQGAFMAVGIVWGIAFMVWAACKHGGTTVTTTTTEEIEEPASNYKETKFTIPRESIKEVLREMGLAQSEEETNKRLGELEKALTRDYSALMKRMDEMRNAQQREVRIDPPAQPPTEGGLS